MLWFDEKSISNLLELQISFLKIYSDIHCFELIVNIEYVLRMCVLSPIMKKQIFSTILCSYFFRIQHVKSDSRRYWKKEFSQWNKIYRFSQWKCSWLFRLPWARESFIRYPNMNKGGPRAMQAITWLMIIQNLVIGHFFDVNFRLWSSKIYITILKITTNRQSYRATKIKY